MSSRVEKALENHGKGYNCCQAVACAYAELVGVDENLIFAAGEGFGAGMGGMQCTCGAVSGACMVAGLLRAAAIQKNRSQKVRHIVSAERSFRNLERRTVPWSARI